MADELLKTPLHAVLRLAGVDLEAIARAAAALERALASDNPEHALRAADQVWRLLGAYSRRVADDRPKGSGRCDPGQPGSLRTACPPPKALAAQAAAAPESPRPLNSRKPR
jgi:hypothetical protein